VVLLLFVFVYRPLHRRTVRLDRELGETWTRLTDLNLKNKIRLGLDLETVNQNLTVAEKSVASLQRTCRRVFSQLEFDEETRARMNQPFQLLDYERNRFQTIDRLTRLAVSNRVALELAAVDGLPQFGALADPPNRLWARLSLSTRLLTALITNRVSAVQTLQMLPTRHHLAPGTDQPLYDELPMHLQLTGSMESVLKVLQTLPSRSSFSDTIGPPLPPSQALFLDRLILKSATNNPSAVILDAILSGFLVHPELP